MSTHVRSSAVLLLAAPLLLATEAAAGPEERAERAARTAEAVDRSRDPAEDAADAAAAAAPVRPPAPPEKPLPWHHFVDQSTRAVSEPVSAPTTLRIVNRELIIQLATVAPTPCYTLDTEVRGRPLAHELQVRVELRDDGICLDQPALIEATIRIPALASAIWQVQVERPEGPEVHEARMP
jgi:hypothetical protein